MRHSILFWHSLFLVSLIIFISLITFVRLPKGRPNDRSFVVSQQQLEKGKAPFPHRLSTSIKGTRLLMAWNLNWSGQSFVNFQVTFTGRAAIILIGFSDHGAVEGSDFCLFWVKESRMVDGWVDKRWRLRRDIHQDCELTNSRSNQFEFRRKLATCDPRDYRIEKGTSNILLAVSTHKRIKSLRDPNVVHQIRFTQLLMGNNDNGEAWDSDEVPDKLPNLFTMDIRAQNVSIPARVTTYWCAIVELEEAVRGRKHHVIKYEPIITEGNVQLVHHFEVFHCQQRTRPFAGDCSENKPPEARSCSKVLAAWAMGANKIVYPPEAGMPLGGVDFVPFLMIEIHYNNEHKLAGIRDSSGLRITYTDQLRPNDAGIMELGLIYSDANSIPPDQSNFPITAFCTSDCTQKFPTNGIYIFASQLHAHLTGRKLYSSVIRDGKKVAEINRDNHYSPHWQHIQSLRPHVHVQSGDVLTTTCEYETRGLKHWTWGGYSLEDEMCVNYIHYYPVEVCKSAVSNASLHAFFTRLGVKNKQLKIHEKYSAVKWTKAKLDSLRELYAVAPLNVACLQHSGRLFPGHLTNWSRVPMPEYGIEHATNDGQAKVGECLAMND